jgi:hypothetical protein
MSEPDQDKNQEKGDEVLRRLLKTPPDHKTAGRGEKKRGKPRDSQKDQAASKRR